MKHLICSLLVSLLLVPLAWSQTRAIKPVRIEAKTAQDKSISYIYEESHALIIGISDYTNGWAKLPGVKTDVGEVSRALEENGFEVEVVEDPTLDELEIAIEDFIFDKGADPENRLLIYYAGQAIPRRWATVVRWATWCLQMPLCQKKAEISPSNEV